MDNTSITRPNFYPLIGLIIGIFLAYALEVGLLETWHSLGKPPEPISRIIGANENTVYVLTTAGKTFSFTYFQPGGTKSNTWEEVIENDYKIISNYHPGYFISLPPLFKTIQVYELDVYPLMEAGGQVKFALSNDKTIWMWRHISMGMAVIFLPIFPVFGLGIGLLLSRKRTTENKQLHS